MGREYGRVKTNGRDWIIECEPQVRTRLKRVFPRASQEADKIRLVASIENSRELEWFMERYPLAMADDCRQDLAAKSRAHRQREVDLVELMEGRHQVVHGELAKPARDYQLLPTEMMMITGGLLLADQVGIGKTVSAMVAMTQPKHLPAVVVYPASLPNHWPEKLAEFLPHLKVHHINSGQPYPLLKSLSPRKRDLWETLPDVILISYHKLRGWADHLARIAVYVIFEECQQLRNSDSLIYEACQTLAMAAELRMGLSATPIYNYGGEFFNVIQILQPDALGGRDEFLREWCISGGDKPRLRDPVEFGHYLRRNGLMLARTRADVGRELPPVTRIVQEFDVDEAVLSRHATGAELLARVILNPTGITNFERMQASGEFERIMRQATGVAKAPFVAEFVRMLAEEGHQVVLFGWHRMVYDIWLEQLADLNPVLYTGSESPNQKRESVERFIAGTSRVIIISLRAGAGIDGLQTVCHHAVYGELDWSPGVMEQTLGRVDRDMQENGVMSFYLTSTSGADPIMSQVLGLKQWQLDGVMQADKSLVERTDIGANALRELARHYCEQKGIAA